MNSYTDSAQAVAFHTGEIMGHRKKMIQATFGQHPTTVLAVMVILVAMIGFFIYKLIKGNKKDHFGIRQVNNMTTGGNNPLWWHGSADAGSGGSIHRDITRTQASVYMPNLRYYDGIHEGLETSPDESGVTASPCPAGMTALTYQDVDGALLTRCVSKNGLPSVNHGACRENWNPAASAEAQALATVGSFQHDHYGEKNLQHAINAAYDRNVPLNEVQLNEFLHQGGSP